MCLLLVHAPADVREDRRAALDAARQPLPRSKVEYTKIMYSSTIVDTNNYYSRDL